MLDKQAIERLPILQYGDLVIDPQRCIVTLSEIEINLYPKEFEVLFLLAQHPTWVLTPKQIYESVWQEEWWGCKHIINNIICQLRRKLGRTDLIQTVVGYGYKLEI